MRFERSYRSTRGGFLFATVYHAIGVYSVRRISAIGFTASVEAVFADPRAGAMNDNLLGVSVRRTEKPGTHAARYAKERAAAEAR